VTSRRPAGVVGKASGDAELDSRSQAQRVSAVANRSAAVALWYFKCIRD